MNKSSQVLLLIGGILVVTAIPFVIVTVVFQHEISFSASDFVNDGVDFVIGLVSMLVSFWVANVYWAFKVEEQQAGRMHSQLTYFAHNISRITSEAMDRLSSNVGDSSQAIWRDQKILANLVRLGDWCDNALQFLNESSFGVKRDTRIVRAGLHFRSVIAPVLERLSKRERIRPEADAVYTELAFVSKQVESLLMYLQGGSNELDTAGESDPGQAASI